MAYQLVYTSAAKLLDAGRSGFGTVARSKSITPLVVSTIERVSQFANLRGLDRSRVIHVHRRITAGSNRLHLLTRIVDAGADYTGRTNHIAHHLVVSQEEAAKAAVRGITPADILRQFPWLDRWEGGARYFDASEDVPLDIFRPDGKKSARQYWSSVTGNPAHSRLLAWDGAARTGAMIVPEGANALSLLAEALAEFGAQAWSRSFTTSLETTDELSDLDWIVSPPRAFVDIQPRCGSRTLLDVTNPSSLPVPLAPSLPSPSLTPITTPSAIAANPTLATPTGLSERSSSNTPVNVRSAEKVSKSVDSTSRRSTPIPVEKKSHLGLLLGAATLAVFIALMAIVVSKNKSGGKEGVVEEIVQKPDPIKKLKEVGVTDEEARQIVAKLASEEDAIVCANFISYNIGRIKNAKSIEDLKSIDITSNNIKSNPNWLNSLIDASHAIVEYTYTSSKDTTAADLLSRLKKIGDICQLPQKRYRLKIE